MQIQAQGTGHLAHGFLGRLYIQIHMPVQQAWRQAPQQQVRIRHCWLLPPLAVAGRARRRAGAFWTHPQGASHGHMGDGAAPSADRMNLDRRHLDGVIAQRGLAADQGFAVLDQRDIRGRPAHVEPQGILVTRQGGHEGRARYPARRSRHHGMDRAFRGPLNRHQAAVGADDVDVGRELDGFQLFFEIGQITPHGRPHIGVHHGHQRAFVLAKLRQDVGRKGNGNIRPGFLDDRAQAPFVIGIGVGMQQGNGDRFHAGVYQFPHRPAGRHFVQG